MRIFSKKAFQFNHPKNAALFVIVAAAAFADVEDWVADSTMFKLASKDGDVEVIGGRADEKAAETGAKGKTKAEKEAEAKAKADAKDKLDGEIKENVAGFASLTEDEQISVLKGQQVEPASSLKERVLQYTELVTKEFTAANQQ